MTFDECLELGIATVALFGLFAFLEAAWTHVRLHWLPAHRSAAEGYPPGSSAAVLSAGIRSRPAADEPGAGHLVGPTAGH